MTAKERTSISFPAKVLLRENLIKGSVLDFGCGFGKDVEALKEKGLNVVGYDKHYSPTYPNQRFDTIVCFYVLNVLLPEEQAIVLMQISQLLKPTGKAYFAVRRDLRFEGYRTHRVHKKQTYQCTVKLAYKTVFRNENCEIYEYQHLNQLKRISENNCPFCEPDSDRSLIMESATAYAIYDRFPVNEGHALIIPKHHVSSYFELSFREQSACWFMLNQVKKVLQDKYDPDGFNIGVNINEDAGQTVSHVHIHLIPRYNGDVKEPRGGVRGVIPKKKEY